MRYAWFAVTLLLAGCQRSPDGAAMMEMTAEEHARMLGGGTAPATEDTTYAGRQPVHLTAAQERALGVAYMTVARASVTRTIRTVGSIQAPEPGLFEVTTKLDGFVESLVVATSGELVRAGTPMLTLYSPAVVAAQEELLSAARLVRTVAPEPATAGRQARELLEAARRRLLWWDLPAAWIERIEASGQVERVVTLPAPAGGVVLERLVVPGQRVMPGMPLYRLADLASVWIEGEVFERDLRYVRPGAEVHVEVQAYPGEHLMGRVEFVYPTVDPATRTNRVRVTLPNPRQRLKPGMFATMYLDVPLGEVLLVPKTAIILTGRRNLVFVREGDGHLVPRPVVLGSLINDAYEILGGLAEGEVIVRAANFLVDAESRLGGMPAEMPGMQHGGHAGHGGPAPAPPPAAEHRHD
jgi:Cu(I)/Ag(I) efflux system membrane fusion protein